MLNYENITKSMPRKLANILAAFYHDNELEKITIEYCKQCPLADICPAEESGKSCTVSDSDIFLWWLNQEAR